MASLKASVATSGQMAEFMKEGSGMAKNMAKKQGTNWNPAKFTLANGRTINRADFLRSRTKVVELAKHCLRIGAMDNLDSQNSEHK